ncbi:phenylalanine--tRNA ligase subunit beta [Dyella sp. LX-66]|uniref:phenylalanine--tRNA ligase subunit beta n=1 Tax=unclassified Dyella TaxID=2634549 RepID=UPI001BE04A88|nr:MULTISPECIES: phenylalanine--tRNA ligase subunit beta [unclassified Dyella]MBT2118764.1 phenylalanine--tRNA ligase subunit beta [Dyella sp. LX-1]MBT2141113.1 phenylalanine--tRNA ligase subunit beta [Dyella sp. LX-66]
MKFSENWLRHHVPTNASRDELAATLTAIGLEVEDVAALGESLDGVIVARIVSAQKHPEADRLQVCEVDTGNGIVQIVCGAPNARAGLVAPLAMVGAQLPGGIAIKAAKLRGVESFGMLCSAKELDIDPDASGLLELPADAPVGTPLATYLGLPDATIEIKLTPNRADCFSVRGIAFDVAAALNGGVIELDARPVPAQSDAAMKVVLEAGERVPRFAGRVIDNVDASVPTPVWMAERLRRSGLRPISFLVDVTQYVMLELGQPMHAFDKAKLEGEIVVRPARAGEPLALLDGRTVELDDDFLVVSDSRGGRAARAVALGGIMGGQDTRVTEATRSVFLEAAHWIPSAIIGRSRKLGMHTDAGHRFERGVDPQLPGVAVEYATRLILDIAGGVAGPLIDVTLPEHLRAPQPILLRRARLGRVLGLTVADDEVARIFTALGMQVEPQADGWRVTAPSRRFDIEREEDLIEEVARIHGYENIPTHTPAGALTLAVEPEARLGELALREQLAARGYYEAVSLAFIGSDVLQRWGMTERLVPLANPLSADLAVMRPSLLPGLIEALRHNRARQQERVRLFEVARVFAAGDPPVETPSLAIAACGSARAEQWGEASRPLDFHDLKGELDAIVAWGGEPQRWSVHADGLPGWLHPGRGARVARDGQTVGYLGALHPQLAKALDLGPDVHVLELALEPLLARRLPKAASVPRFPSVRRDIAVDLPEEVSWAQVEQSVRAAVGGALAELRLFDRYAGKGVETGRKSLAMGLILQDASRTLTDDDADRFVREAFAALETSCKARWRG